MIQSHLVSKQDHDGVAACSRRSVFDSECVVVVPDDVKVDIGLGWSHHSGGALDSYTDVTWGQETIVIITIILSADALHPFTNAWRQLKHTHILKLLMQAYSQTIAYLHIQETQINISINLESYFWPETPVGNIWLISCWILYFLH